VNFTPLSPEEHAQLRAALQNNGAHGTPLSMSRRNTTAVLTGTPTRRLGLGNRLRTLFLGRREEENLELFTDQAEADTQVIDQIASVPTHY
jgi:hypothetical protein